MNLERRTIATSLPAEPKLPSLAVIKQRAKEAFAAFGPGDPEVGRLMHALIPSLKVYPVRLCDGQGGIDLQARVQINLAALTDQRVGIDVTSAFRHEITVNLFDAPQREMHRLQVVSMRAAKMTGKQVATELDLTITATQRTAALQRRINELWLTDSYVPVLSVADLEGSRCKRHLHARYQFQPLDDGASES